MRWKPCINVMNDTSRISLGTWRADAIGIRGVHVTSSNSSPKIEELKLSLKSFCFSLFVVK